MHNSNHETRKNKSPARDKIINLAKKKNNIKMPNNKSQINKNNAEQQITNFSKNKKNPKCNENKINAK